MQSACRGDEAVITRLRQSYGEARRTEERIADCVLRIFQLKTVSQFVIPAKSRKAGREPGSRKNWTIYKSLWIPDLVRRSGLVRNDDFYGFNDFNDFRDLRYSMAAISWKCVAIR